jgi:hypothetical protein
MRMEPITVPAEDSAFGPFSELKQVSVAADEEVSAVNALLQDGWKLLHIGHSGQLTVYVLGRMPQSSRRRTGFLA